MIGRSLLEEAAEKNPDGLRKLARRLGVDAAQHPLDIANQVEDAIRVLWVKDWIARQKDERW